MQRSSWSIGSLHSQVFIAEEVTHHRDVLSLPGDIRLTDVEEVAPDSRGEELSSKLLNTGDMATELVVVVCQRVGAEVDNVLQILPVSEEAAVEVFRSKSPAREVKVAQPVDLEVSGQELPVGGGALLSSPEIEDSPIELVQVIQRIDKSAGGVGRGADLYRRIKWHVKHDPRHRMIFRTHDGTETEDGVPQPRLPDQPLHGELSLGVVIPLGGLHGVGDTYHGVLDPITVDRDTGGHGDESLRCMSPQHLQEVIGPLDIDLIGEVRMLIRSGRDDRCEVDDVVHPRASLHECLRLGDVSIEGLYVPL